MSKAHKQSAVHLSWGLVFSFALASLFLSYRPTIFLGSVGGANLEISLTQVGIGLFIVASIGAIVVQRRTLMKSVPLLLLTGLAVVSSLSLLWTTNEARGLLVSVLLWVIVALWAALQGQSLRLYQERVVLQKVGWWAVVGVVVFGWFQVFADALGVSSFVTLLPQPYVSGVFGFARPTGFALEPQFLGSLLLAPILYGVYRELRGTATAITRILWLMALSGVIATLSRGAYIALFIGVVVLFSSSALSAWRHMVRIVLLAGSVIVVSLGLLAGAAQLNTRDSTSGVNAVIQAINHVSIGVVDIPRVPEGGVKQEVSELREQSDNGYVEESTTSRLSMSHEALALWVQSPRTLLVGVGAGGFGAALHEKYPQHSLSSIVNNQYIETLVELGLVGLVLFLAVIGYILLRCITRRSWLLLAIVAAYLVQWCFFSGSINVLHIWVVCGVMLFVMATKPHARDGDRGKIAS